MYALPSTACSSHPPLYSSSADSDCHSAVLNSIKGRCVCFYTRSYPKSVAQACLLKICRVTFQLHFVFALRFGEYSSPGETWHCKKSRMVLSQVFDNQWLFAPASSDLTQPADKTVSIPNSGNTQAVFGCFLTV